MNQEIITMLIIYITIVSAIVMTFTSISKANKTGNACSGNCTGCKIDLSEIDIKDKK